MSTHEFDLLKLDVAAFAKEGCALSGHSKLGNFPRIVASGAAGATDADAELSWLARGELVGKRSEQQQIWLYVHAKTEIALECQRCLKPVVLPIEIDRRFLFVHGEDVAAQLDAESEDDVLALTHALDLHELIEDEILLALPIVPRHEICSEPLVLSSKTSENGELSGPSVHPFAALAVLKRNVLN